MNDDLCPQCGAYWECGCSKSRPKYGTIKYRIDTTHGALVVDKQEPELSAKDDHSLREWHKRLFQ